MLYKLSEIFDFTVIKEECQILLILLLITLNCHEIFFYV